jgi:hypothetical protein
MDEATSRADLRTLALATPPIDAEKISQLVKYQTAMVDQLRQVPHNARKGSAWEHWLAKAHEQAVGFSGLSHQELSRLGTVCSDYCSKRRTELELRRKRDKVASSPDANPEVLMELDKALARIASSTSLVERYGQNTLDRLKEREDELLPLHEELWRPS